MSITSGIYNVLQQQATLDQTRATTQDTQALAQVRQQNAQLQGIEIQQRLNTQRAMQDVAGGFKGYDPALAPSPEDSATEAMRKEAGRQRADAQFMRNMAISVAKAGGDMKAVDEWNNRANVASYRSTQASREALQESSKELSQVSGIAATVTDDASLNAFMQQLSTINGTTAKNIATQLDRDPYTNAFTLGSKSQTVINTLIGQGEGAAKRQELALKAAAQVEKQRDEDRKVQESKARVDELNSVTAVNRERVANLAAERAGTLPARPSRTAGAGADGKPLTIPQQRQNEMIEEARAELSSISNSDISKFYDNFDVESVRNPKMLNVLQQATLRKYGDDPDYKDVRSRLSPTANIAGKAASPAAAPAKKSESGAQADPMNAQVAPLTPMQIQTVAKLKGVAPVLNDGDWDKLNKGDKFIGPDGRIRTK